jgi:hypothetical protein
VRLLHLHDIALLSASLSAADWDELLSPSCAARWWALPPLELTARYYPTAAIPAQVLEALAEGCSGLLRQVHRRRTLSDESLSYLWIGAFPGIEWSRTPAEMLRYAANRIRPSGAMREQRRELLRHRPPGSQTHWQHLSQGRRMLRWLISRPARDESLAAVQAALAVSS